MQKQELPQLNEFWDDIERKIKQIICQNLAKFMISVKQDFMIAPITIERK